MPWITATGRRDKLICLSKVLKTLLVPVQGATHSNCGEILLNVLDTNHIWKHVWGHGETHWVR